MRLLFVRHGDPDYKNDCLSEIGLREAHALAALGPRMDWGTCFVSPLGRAQETAAVALGRAVHGMHGAAAAVGCTDLSSRTADDPFFRTAFGARATDDAINFAKPGAADSTSGRADLIRTLDWLQEFPAQVDLSAVDLLQDAYCFRKNEDGTYKRRIVWDMYPSYYLEHPDYSDYGKWRTTPLARHSNVVSEYDRVVSSFDGFLAERGYVRDGRHYRVEKESTETITFFCHFGITCVLLSHMWNVSPFVTLQSLCMPTSSVTELYTEERRQGYAHFRTTRIGDTTHLTMAGLKPERLPYSALFAEVYSDFSQRHD